MVSPAALRRACFGFYLALIALVALWEGWLAPPGHVPRAAWLVIKLVPLSAMLVGIWRGSARSHVLAALVVLLYFIEGVVLAFSGAKGLEDRATLIYALVEIVLTTTFFVCAAIYARLKARMDAASAPVETGS